MKTKPLKLCYLCRNYVAFLHSFEKKVRVGCESKSAKTPCLGVLVEIKNRKYFAPLISPKKLHARLLQHDPTTFKIQHKGKLIGSILLNNMIPVKDFVVFDFRINDVADLKLRNLLLSKYRILRRSRRILADKAFILYDNVINQRNPYFNKVSCNFKKLEEISQFFTAEDVIKQ